MSAAILLLAVAAQAAPLCVYYHPAFPWVEVKRPVLCYAFETPEGCRDRICVQDCPKDKSGACLPHDRLDDADLPGKNDRSKTPRNKWRGAKGRGVWVDNVIVLKHERVAAAESALDAELAKAAPNVAELIRLFRSLEKARAAPSDFELK